MNKVTSTLLVLLIIVLFIVLIINHKRTKYTYNIPLNTYNVFQFNSSFSNLNESDKPVSPFVDVFNKYSTIFGTTDNFKSSNLLLFSDYSLIDQNISSIPFDKTKYYYIYGLKGSDEMANKANLAYHMRSIDKYIPKTYILEKQDDLIKLQEQHKDGNLYILKKNIQRQEGTFISNDIDFILNKSPDQGYVVCQELLQNPYIVNGRKINIRIYLLAVIDENNNMDFFIYKNGFMYYTPKMFEKGSIDRDTNITTGYIDRQVYEENPLTLHDLMKFIGKENTEKLSENMIEMFRELKNVYEPILRENNKNIPGMKFNIFGVDVAPTEGLETQLIEINKGPDLNSDQKGQRDKELKQGMIYDCFNLVGLIDDTIGNKNNFIKL